MNSIDNTSKSNLDNCETPQVQTLHSLDDPIAQNDINFQNYCNQQQMNQLYSGNQIVSTGNVNQPSNQIGQQQNSQSEKLIPNNNAESKQQNQPCQFQFDKKIGKLLSESIQRKNEHNEILEKQNEKKFLQAKIFEELESRQLPLNQRQQQNLHKFVITKQMQQQQQTYQTSFHSQNQFPPNFPLYSYNTPNMPLASSSDILTKFEEEQKQSQVQLSSDKNFSSDWLQNIINPEQQDNESRVPSLIYMNDCESEEKNSNNNNINVFTQNVMLLVQEQSGCRLLQKELDKKDPVSVTNIFNQIILIMNSVVIDQYGNYLCQKLAETCSAQQFLVMLQAIKPNFTPIAVNQYGTRAVQKFIEIMTTVYSPYSIQNQNLNFQQRQNQIQIYYLMLNEISQGMLYNFVILSSDSNGNHVICKCLQNLSNEDKQFLYNEAMQKLLQISMNKHGCCTMQRFFDFGSPEQKNQLFQVVLANLILLIQDQFGNYVIQYILEQPKYEDYKHWITTVMLNELISLSKSKFSSNVLEKCIKSNVSNFRDKAIEYLVKTNTVQILLNDKYANYVIQRCLSCANQTQLKLLLQQIMLYREMIQTNSFGVKILQKIQKTYAQQYAQLQIPLNTCQNQQKSFISQPGLQQIQQQQQQQQYIQSECNLSTGAEQNNQLSQANSLQELSNLENQAGKIQRLSYFKKLQAIQNNPILQQQQQQQQQYQQYQYYNMAQNPNYYNLNFAQNQNFDEQQMLISQQQFDDYNLNVMLDNLNLNEPSDSTEKQLFTN